MPESEWTDGMKNIVMYAKFLAKELMGIDLVVEIVDTTNKFVACYEKGRLDLNLHALGAAWFNQGATEEVDRLLVHELGHQFSGDHLSSEYRESLCRLAAGLKRLALERPGVMEMFMGEAKAGRVGRR